MLEWLMGTPLFLLFVSYVLVQTIISFVYISLKKECYRWALDALQSRLVLERRLQSGLLTSSLEPQGGDLKSSLWINGFRVYLKIHPNNELTFHFYVCTKGFGFTSFLARKANVPDRNCLGEFVGTDSKEPFHKLTWTVSLPKKP